MRANQKAPPGAPPAGSGFTPPELRRVDKDAPDLGGQVQLRDLYLSERLAFRRIIAQLERDAVTAGVQAGDLMVPQLLAICVERDGRPVMTAQQWEVFGAINNRITLELFDAACDLCGFVPDEAAKN